MPHSKGAYPYEEANLHLGAPGDRNHTAGVAQGEQAREVLPWTLPGAGHEAGGWSYRGNGIYDESRMEYLRDDRSHGESSGSGDLGSDDYEDSEYLGDYAGGGFYDDDDDDGEGGSSSDEVLYGDDAVAALEASSRRYEEKQAVLRAEAKAAARLEAEEARREAVEEARRQVAEARRWRHNPDRSKSIDASLSSVDLLRESAWQEFEEVHALVEASLRAPEDQPRGDVPADPPEPDPPGPPDPPDPPGPVHGEASASQGQPPAGAEPEARVEEEEEEEEEETEETEEAEEEEAEETEGAGSLGRGGMPTMRAYSVTVLETAAELAAWPRSARESRGSGPL
jgi:hypothetical protein